MKTSMTLLDLATELDRQAKAKNDYIAPTNLMTMVLRTPGPGPTMFAMTMERHRPVRHRRYYAHRQIGEHTNIPFRYYGHMMTEAPGLLTAQRQPLV